MRNVVFAWPARLCVHGWVRARDVAVALHVGVRGTLGPHLGGRDMKRRRMHGRRISLDDSCQLEATEAAAWAQAFPSCCVAKCMRGHAETRPQRQGSEAHTGYDKDVFACKISLLTNVGSTGFMVLTSEPSIRNFVCDQSEVCHVSGGKVFSIDPTEGWAFCTAFIRRSVIQSGFQCPLDSTGVKQSYRINRSSLLATEKAVVCLTAAPR